MRDWSCRAGRPARRPERLLREADDDLDELAAGGGRLRARGSGRERDEAEQAEQETPAHGGHGR